jgi:hypothetical protein
MILDDVSLIVLDGLNDQSFLTSFMVLRRHCIRSSVRAVGLSLPTIPGLCGSFVCVGSIVWYKRMTDAVATEYVDTSIRKVVPEQQQPPGDDHPSESHKEEVIDIDEEDVIDDEQIEEFKEQLEALGSYPVCVAYVLWSMDFLSLWHSRLSPNVFFDRLTTG